MGAVSSVDVEVVGWEERTAKGEWKARVRGRERTRACLARERRADIVVVVVIVGGREGWGVGMGEVAAIRGSTHFYSGLCDSAVLPTLGDDRLHVLQGAEVHPNVIPSRGPPHSLQEFDRKCQSAAAYPSVTSLENG